MRVFPLVILNERMFRVSFPYIVRVEGNGLVSSVYKCPLSQELGVWYIAQEGGMTV